LAGIVGQQLTLLGNCPLRFDDRFTSIERISLAHGAWLDLARGWVTGDGELFELLLEHVRWRTESRKMYDRTVEVPRQYAVLADDARDVHPILQGMRRALDARYATSFERLSVALYRDGQHSVAWHGDYVARRMPEAHVATISVGAPRRFLLRPTGGGRSIAFNLGWGDLLVMGGSCQRTYQHAIPKVAKANPRIAIMYRPRWKEKDAEAPPTSEQEANGGAQEP
jgi:alkylated DNA repair dioxygenase AlkB